MANADYFLKIDGIDGESQDSKHKNEIELDSFSWGSSNSGSMSGNSGGGTGKVSMQDFHFTMPVNKAAPKLQHANHSGQHIKTAELVCRKAGGDQQEYLKYKFSDVIVSSYQLGGSQGASVMPTCQVSLNFAKIETEYSPQKPDGSLDAPVKAGWNLKENKKV